METAGFEMRCHYLIGFIALAWHRASLYPDFQMVAHFDAVNSVPGDTGLRSIEN